MEVPWGCGVKRQWGCQQWQFLTFSQAVSSETLEIRPALLYSNMQSIIGFSVIPSMTLNISMTLNDLEWLFHIKFDK